MLKGKKMVLKIYISQSRNLSRCSGDQEEVCCNRRKSAKQIWDSKSHSSLKDINCCVSVCTSECSALEGRKRMLDALELMVEAFVSCLTPVLGPEGMSSLQEQQTTSTTESSLQHHQKPPKASLYI